MNASPRRLYQFEFRDIGIGIAPSDIPKIFDRFNRIRSAASEDVGGAV